MGGLNDNFHLTTLILIIISVLLYFVGGRLSSSFRLKSRGLSLPPGPTRRWISGNLHQLPGLRQRPWSTIGEWAKTYGPLIYIRVLNKESIFINSGKVALDLLESRSSIYSDRPRLWMSGELAGRKRSVFFMPFSNPDFKLSRRLLQTGLNQRASKSYRPIQMKESRVLLKALVDSPKDFVAHIRRNSVAVIVKVAYGYEVVDNDDPLLPLIEGSVRMTGQLNVLGKYWIEFMPFLRFIPDWFPGANFKQVAKRAKVEMSRLDKVPFEWAKKQIAGGDYIESYASKYLVGDDGHLLVLDDAAEDNIKWTSAALYGGGGDTTVSALQSFFFFMTLNPEVQKRAQSDIEQVAPDRLPDLDDYAALPYVQAIIKEVLRCAPVVPMGLPHRVMEDDVYGSYFIPKGATVSANIWAITHDEELYPSPHIFDPSRHLGDHPQPDPFKFVFGFGRRICPGAHFAEMSLFLNFASILAVFNISKAVDGGGKVIEPKAEFTTGITMHLEPFECQITPRSEERLAFLDRN